MIRRDELRKNRLFREFTDQELDMVRVVADEGTFEDGRLIIAEGSPGERLYFIDEGRCSVTTEISGAGREEIKLMEAGDFFGEMSLIEAAPVSASVYARGPCRLLWIDRKAFDRLLAEDMPIANKLLKAIILTFGERIRDTAAKIESYYKMSKY
jgi:CRP/FNR family cyclic AMP-dependent transcriptional regulator